MKCEVKLNDDVTIALNYGSAVLERNLKWYKFLQKCAQIHMCNVLVQCKQKERVRSLFNIEFKKVYFLVS